ncbi:DNA-3-methyladenine glycosylase [Pararcticibacter amylolyticus]|uniref:Putative 3-methyladenine DNA glycosylase n=1 Tax=Pararcticibacter amylolyticus TaxID=2173175 RepID=A0A2U2PL47_9SPHI|nr:DNA-3-methyladenine glycosylase [Pararcticibacter amylolyticus]PWG82133.1 DNA-3-methyladenine glycosylase [Pararcticibacter amylolyticus]
MNEQKLPLSFYLRDDVVQISRDLIGKQIFTYLDGLLTSAIIVETEAYRGPEDKGSHAFNGRRTARNDIMYYAGGVTYMYICYGIHDMLNIVTGPEGTSHAVLIRALQPVDGLDIMRERRAVYSDDKRLCKGPGALARAMGLNKTHNGLSLLGDQIWLEDRGLEVPEEDIVASARIGLNIDSPYKEIPWRFYIRGNRYVSKWG